MNEQSIEIALLVIHIVDKLKIPYLIGGSLASSIYGVARATLDADSLADIEAKHISLLEAELQNDFYISSDQIATAIALRTSFNLIHFATAFKVDVFVPKHRLFDERELSNRVLKTVAINPTRSAYIATAEDVILAKLERYRQGNEVSDRQWLDILGIIKVQDKVLDLDYLRRGAEELTVTDLLERALDSK